MGQVWATGLGVDVELERGWVEQVVRFYVPALGAIALLGAWLVTRIPGRAWQAGVASAAVITVMFVLGVWSFYAMYRAFGVPLGG